MQQNVEQYKDRLNEDRLIRLPEVLRLTGLSKSTIYRMQSENRFPQRVYCSERGVAWHLREIMDWISARDSVAPGTLK